jgi:hypothetical protein
MNDLDIRKALLGRFTTRNLFDLSSILEEVPVSNGCARADIVVAGKKLECFEIKSEFDSLKRLTQQGWHYSRSFNQVTLVAATKHLDKAVPVIPLWWGIIDVTKNGKLVQFRRPSNNPDIKSHGLAELLDRDEGISLLNLCGISKGIAKLSNKDIHDKISYLCDVGELNKLVLSALINRKELRKDSFLPQFFHELAVC